MMSSAKPVHDNVWWAQLRPELRRFLENIQHDPVLFPTEKSKLSVVRQLMDTEWVSSASSLCASSDEDSVVGKLYHEPIEVRWDKAAKRPRAFRWRGRRYKIDAIIRTWVVEMGWWDPDTEVSKVFLRVTSGGGVYDILYDKRESRWYLGGVAD